MGEMGDRPHEAISQPLLAICGMSLLLNKWKDAWKMVTAAGVPLYILV